MHSDVPLKVVSWRDPAIDLTRCNVAKYRRTLDYSCLTFVPGREPAVFWLRRIPYELLFSHVSSAPTEDMKAVRAFECAVTKIENFVSLEGERIAFLEPKGQIAVGGVRMQILEAEDLRRIPPLYLQTIGEVARDRAFLLPGNEGSYPLPPSFPRDLETTLETFLSAGADRETPTPISGRPSKEPDPASPAPSDKPTGASATAALT